MHHGGYSKAAGSRGKQRAWGHSYTRGRQPSPVVRGTAGVWKPCPTCKKFRGEGRAARYVVEARTRKVTNSKSQNVKRPTHRCRMGTARERGPTQGRHTSAYRTQALGRGATQVCSGGNRIAIPRRARTGRVSGGRPQTPRYIRKCKTAMTLCTHPTTKQHAVTAVSAQTIRLSSTRVTGANHRSGRGNGGTVSRNPTRDATDKNRNSRRGVVHHVD